MTDYTRAPHCLRQSPRPGKARVRRLDLFARLQRTLPERAILPDFGELLNEKSADAPLLLWCIRDWEKRYPGIFDVSGGPMVPTGLNGPGLGAS